MQRGINPSGQPCQHGFSRATNLYYQKNITLGPFTLHSNRPFRAVYGSSAPEPVLAGAVQPQGGPRLQAAPGQSIVSQAATFAGGSPKACGRQVTGYTEEDADLCQGTMSLFVPWAKGARAGEKAGEKAIAEGPRFFGFVRGLFGGRGAKETVRGGRGAEAMTIDPALVRFSQDSIRGTFKNGGSVDDLAEGLKNGAIRASDVPLIRVVERDGHLFSLDNRRLEAFRKAGVPVRYRYATPEEAANEAFKFTTRDGGQSVRVRGG